ncbi:MAG: alpha-isopropylmalate synthase regulatory domain-containing protein [Hyphomonas sp.]
MTSWRWSTISWRRKASGSCSSACGRRRHRRPADGRDRPDHRRGRQVRHRPRQRPVDAVFNAIKELIPHAGRLDLYQVHAVTGGTDAQATVSVRLNDADGFMATGRASDPDTLVASAKAYLHAVNKLEIRKSKSKAA